MSPRNPVAFAAGQEVRKQLQVLLEAHYATHGPLARPPSIKSLCAAVGRSRPQVQRHLRALRTTSAE